MNSYQFPFRSHNRTKSSQSPSSAKFPEKSRTSGVPYSPNPAPNPQPVLPSLPLAPMPNSIPTFHSGPFLPGMFSSRRVWVRRPNGTPTTLMVHQNDIIDDLKQAVADKFPNSLGRVFDPADLSIKMDLQARHVANQKQSKKPAQRPEDPISPVYGLVNLEPDQNVWQLLDAYYPNGMGVNEAFLIETPEIQPHLSVAHAPPRAVSNGHIYHPTPIVHPRADRSTTPLSVNTQYKSQYYQLNNASPTGTKDRSILPATIKAKSPGPGNFHRRSHSNPPQLPVTNNKNSQAVLLLPKNFSLNGTMNSGPDSVDKHKRLSLDETMVRHTRPVQPGSPIEEEKTSPRGSNITNIGVGIRSPPNHKVLPRLDVTRKLLSEAGVASSSSDSTITPDSSQKLTTSLPSPPPVVNRLHSPTRDTPTRDTPSARSHLSLHSLLQEKDKKKDDKGRENIKAGSVQVLPSISVLVVEDNAINQAILGAFLRKHKIHYQIAKNGQEAIDKWKTGGFHLVLMDIQLPVKSGIEATKEIRHLEKVNRIGVFAQNELTNNNLELELSDDEKLDLNVFRSPVIIVALTASSNSSVDKKNALTAGCNDYLTKPVNLVWLQNKITEWGCMQALIDFDGWRIKGSKNK